MVDHDQSPRNTSKTYYYPAQPQLTHFRDRTNYNLLLVLKDKPGSGTRGGKDPVAEPPAKLTLSKDLLDV